MQDEVFAPQDMDTVIGPSVQIDGELISQGNIRVEGVLKGTVTTEQNIDVAEGSLIEADVKAIDMLIAGNVKGNVEAEGKITITETGHVQGDITCGMLAIQPGAVFSGQSHMNSVMEEEEMPMEDDMDEEVEEEMPMEDDMEEETQEEEQAVAA